VTGTLYVGYNIYTNGNYALSGGQLSVGALTVGATSITISSAGATELARRCGAFRDRLCDHTSGIGLKGFVALESIRVARRLFRFRLVHACGGSSFQTRFLQA
jgi:hypothetical protein